MPTVGEMIDRLKEQKNKKALLEHLIEYVDNNFRSQAGRESEKKLLNDDKLPVTEEAIEAVVTDVLSQSLEETKVAIESINTTMIEE